MSPASLIARPGLDPGTPPACPCCGTDRWQPRWPGFIVCGACGLMTVNQAVSDDELTRLYDEEYFHGREYVDYVADKPAQQRTLAAHLRRVRRRVPPGGRLLEVGCAYGFFLELIQDEYPNSVGIDVAAAAVARARERGLDAREGDLLSIDFAERFDAVCLWDTIEHLPRPRETVERAAQLLKPGGHLFLTTGDFGSLLARAQGARWRQIHPPTHLFYFTCASLRALCGQVGLDEVSFNTVTVHRRLGSALEALARFHARTLSGRLAGVASRFAPRRVLDWSVPLNLGDTLFLAARRADGMEKP